MILNSINSIFFFLLKYLTFNEIKFNSAVQVFIPQVYTDKYLLVHNCKVSLFQDCTSACDFIMNL